MAPVVNACRRSVRAWLPLLGALIPMFWTTTAQAVADNASAADLTPAEDELWVVNPDHGTVGVIATTGGSANTLVAEIPVGAEPWCIDVHPTNGEAWVTSMAENKVYILDVATRSVITTIDDLGFDTFGVSFNPSGTTALVTASGSDEVFAIDVVLRTVTQTIDTYRRPRGIAWRADGARAWVSHLLMPEFFGRVTTIFTSTWTTSEILVNQVFDNTLGGYPSQVQCITLAPAPFDNMLWMPNNMINTTAGALVGNPLAPANIFHAVVSPVNVTTSTHLNGDTYYFSVSGTDVSGSIATDFLNSRAYTAHQFSNTVTVTNNNILSPVEIGVVNAGKGPIGIVTSQTLLQAYCINWLSRDVTVIRNSDLAVVSTVPSTNGPEPLTVSQLNGKQHFFTSNGAMAVNETGSCASCHVGGRHDARPWDLSQFGKHLRSTPDIAGIGWTGAHDWTGDKDEMQDHEFGILEFTGGVGLLGGGANPPLGVPNKGLSTDLDDIGQYMATIVPRTSTPFRQSDGSLTPSAAAGEVIFNNPTVGCATCHVPPFYTDSRLELPFIKHDVGTADPGDTDAAGGFDTPSLCGVWDTGPYLHHHFANSIEAVLTTFNSTDAHGVTSGLTGTEITQLADFVRSIAWPDSTGTPVDAPVIPSSAHGQSLQAAFPNPFEESTSLRFSLESYSEAVRVDIYDVAGRHVIRIADQPFSRGTHMVGWDSRDHFGRRVAPGTYFARLTVNGEPRGEKKMTVIR